MEATQRVPLEKRHRSSSFFIFVAKRNPHPESNAKGVEIDKETLQFGTEKSPIPVVSLIEAVRGDSAIKQIITITNHANKSFKFKIEMEHALDHRVRVKVFPNEGKIKKGKTLEVSIFVNALCTINFLSKLNIELRPRFGKTKTHEIPLSIISETSSSLDPEDLTLNEDIGDGGNAVVYRASYRGKEVAAKKMMEDSIWTAPFFERERKNLEKSQNPYVVNYIGTTLAMKNHPKLIVMEYVKGGDLRSLLHEKVALNDKLKIKMSLNVAMGLQDMHEKGIFHRDLKSSNCLVVSMNEEDEVHLKLADFGSSFDINEESRKAGIDGKDAPGTVTHQAPEGYSELGYALDAADVYSYGVLLYEIWSGKLAYAGFNKEQIRHFVKEGKRLNIPRRVPENIRNLIERCWSVNPKERPTLNEVVAELNQAKNSVPASAAN